MKNKALGYSMLLILLLAIMPIALNVKMAKAGYYVISNPVFEELIDDQGGAWDTYLLYYREGLDLFSGNWRANLRIGDSQAWIDPNYFPATSSVVTSSSIISTLENTVSNPYGLSAGAVTINMNASMIPGTTNMGLRGYRYVVSEPWVMEQTYTIVNTGSDTLADVAFYTYYFSSPYGAYPTNTRPSHVDYTAGIADPMGYVYDITLYGEGDPPWAYTTMSASIAPTGHDVGHGGGYPDLPYYYPSSSRPSAIPTDVLRHVENDDMRDWAYYDAPTGSDPNAVAGAFKWYIGSIPPGASWTIKVLQSVARHDAPVHGVLYAGGSNPGVVYRYTGGTDWVVISPELGYAVLCLVEYEGHLYAGTMSTSDPFGGVGRVYRYDGGTSWTLVGDNLDNQVCSLAVYQGSLYAGTAWQGMKLYRYEGGTTWTQVIPSPIWSGTRSLYVSHGCLLLGDIGWDRFGRWDGTNFYADRGYYEGSCVYDYQDYGDYVYASVYDGRLWRSTDAINWGLVLDYYDGNMWELEKFQGLLYMSYNNGELRASDGTTRGTLVYTAPDGIISMTTDGDHLYFGTGGEAGYYGEAGGIANVYQYDGTSVVQISLDDAMVTGVQVLYVSYVAPLPEPPHAHFEHWPSICTGKTIMFDASGSTPNGGTIVDYKWDFGDGNITTTPDPVITHTYHNPSTYNVSLTVTDTEGLSDTTWQLVTVVFYNHDVAVSQITATPSMVQPGGIVHICVTAKNYGNATETFTLTTTYDSYVRVEPITGLLPGSEITFCYDWDTTGEGLCFHDIVANASTVPCEIYTYNNIKSTRVSIVSFIPGPTTLKVEPSPAKGLVRGYFEVNVTISNLDVYWDMSGFDIKLCYNNTLLKATEIRLGAFATKFNLTYIVVKAINQAEGYAYLSCLWDIVNLTPEERPHPQGNGTLFTVRFLVLAKGQGNLTFGLPSDDSPLAGYPNAAKWCEPDSAIRINYTATKGFVQTIPPIKQDINADGKVDILDVVMAAAAYGSRPGSPNWNPYCDLNGDGHVDILDLVSITSIYGTKYDP